MFFATRARLFFSKIFLLFLIYAWAHQHPSREKACKITTNEKGHDQIFSKENAKNLSEILRYACHFGLPFSLQKTNGVKMKRLFWKKIGKE
jgi:hypothetical protein